MPRAVTRWDKRRARHLRVRTRVKGIPERPRLSVFRSLRRIYAQVIDDVAGRTLAAASSFEGKGARQYNGMTKTQVAREVGAELAQRARAAGVTRVVFDRGGYKFHGRVKALAEAVREGGLEF